MNPAFSTYLDLVRFSAAATVVLSHLAQPRFSSGFLDIFARSGHLAVVIFFVLSGYVIAWVADTKEGDARHYGEARLARLFSVVLPALLLTPLLDGIGRSMSPDIYAGIGHDSVPLVRFAANLFFVSEVWFFDIRPFSNGPFWSISFEAWYYALFGIWFFTRGAPRFWLLLLAAAVAGPPILLEMPVWLLGVALYHLHRRGFSIPSGIATLLAVATIGMLVLVHSLEWVDQFALKFSLLNHASIFLLDWMLGLIVAVHLFAAKSVVEHKWLQATLTSRVIGGSIRALAGMTFTLYLLHYPSLLFFSSVLHTDSGKPAEVALLVVCVVGFVAAVAAVTERKKSVWRRWVVGVFDAAVALRNAWRSRGRSATDA